MSKLFLFIIVMLISLIPANAIPVEYTAYGLGPSQIVTIGTDERFIQQRIEAPEDSIITGYALGKNRRRGVSINNLGIWYKKIDHGGLGQEFFKKNNNQGFDIAVYGKESYDGEVNIFQATCEDFDRVKNNIADIVKGGSESERKKLSDLILGNLQPSNQEENEQVKVVNDIIASAETSECNSFNCVGWFGGRESLAEIATSDNDLRRSRTAERIRNMPCQNKQPVVSKIEAVRYFISRLSFLTCEATRFFYQEFDEKGIFKPESEKQELKLPTFHGECSQSEDASSFPSGNIITSIGVGIEIDD